MRPTRSPLSLCRCQLLFVVVVPEVAAKKAALTRRVQIELARERQWIASALQDALTRTDARSASLRTVRAALRAECGRRRSAGDFLSTRDLLLTEAVKVVLRRRGYDRLWDRPPACADAVPGRPIGYSPRVSDPASRTGRGLLRVDLPDDVGETVRRSAYWVSKPYVDQLLDWAERYGPGPGAAAGEAMKGNPAARSIRLAAALNRPSAAALHRRGELRAKVVTTGDLIREAVDRAASPVAEPLPRE